MTSRTRHAGRQERRPNRRPVSRPVGLRDSKEPVDSVRQYSFDCERKSVLEICRDINTPRSMAVYYLLHENSHESIVQLLTLPPPIRRNAGLRYRLPRGTCNEMRDRVVQAFRDGAIQLFADDYLVSEVMTKNPNLNTAIDRVATAYESFAQAESKCRETNDRVLSWYKGCDDSNFEYLKGARTIVRKILGKLTRAKIDYAVSKFGFGPGATSAVKGADTLLSKKYAAELHITPRLRPYARTLIGPVWGSFPGSDFVVNDESRTTVVPKNAKTDRIIAIEPHMNIFVQSGIGRLIRNQLKHFGFDLKVATEWNRFLASQAQAWGLSTIDLKAASDTVAKRIVRFLLPDDWYALLELARTDHTVCNGARVELQKFSSMGNGFTFELETLIFLSLALSVGSQKELTAVFGDDLIVERRVASKLVDVLELAGFEVNAKKTFLDGSFFESCGTDWYHGVDVRPFYLKGQYHDRTGVNLYIPNAIRRYARLRGGFTRCDALFQKAWISAYRRCSRLEQNSAIPDRSGDDGLVKNFDESAPSRRWCKEHHQWLGRTIPLRPVVAVNTDINGAYVAALHKGAIDDLKSLEYQRGRVVRSGGLRHQLTLGWVDLGPWA